MRRLQKLYTESQPACIPRSGPPILRSGIGSILGANLLHRDNFLCGKQAVYVRAGDDRLPPPHSPCSVHKLLPGARVLL